MARPMIQTKNNSKFDEADEGTYSMIFSAGLTGVGTAAVAAGDEPIQCTANQVALIDEITITARIKDASANTTVTLHVNGQTADSTLLAAGKKLLGATATVAPHDLPFHFPGHTDNVRNQAIYLKPRGNMVVRPSSTLWVNCNTASVAHCHIKYRKKSLIAAIRDGDISPNATLPEVASTNSVATGGTAAATQKAIITAGTVMVSAGIADAGGSNTTMVDAARTEPTDNFWTGKKIKFTSGSNNGQIRKITNFVAATDTMTFSPAVTAATGAGDTYDILDVDEAIEILGFYCTGHNYNAASDNIRLGFWDDTTGGSFASGGASVMVSYARGVAAFWAPQVLVNNTQGCIQGALGSDLYIQATANMAGATPTADYVVMYRRVRTNVVANTSGTTQQTPTSRKKWWCSTAQDPTGQFFDNFFAAESTNTGSVRILGHAGSGTFADNAGDNYLGLARGDLGGVISELYAFNGDRSAGAATVSGSYARDNMVVPVPYPLIPSFYAAEAAADTIVTRFQLAWGTFSSKRGIDFGAIA